MIMISAGLDSRPSTKLVATTFVASSRVPVSRFLPFWGLALLFHDQQRKPFFLATVGIHEIMFRVFVSVV